MEPIKLDSDLAEINKGVTSAYPSEREPAHGHAQILTIQSIRNLEKTIKKLDKQNALLNKRLFCLSIISLILSIHQLIQLIPIISSILNYII